MDIPPVQKKPQSTPSNDERLLALFAHLSPLLGLGIIVPLIIWLVKREDSSFIDDQAKEALNFQISLLIVVMVTTLICVGPFIAIAGLVFAVIAAVESNKGVYYRYPYTFRMIT